MTKKAPAVEHRNVDPAELRKQIEFALRAYHNNTAAAVQHDSIARNARSRAAEHLKRYQQLHDLAALTGVTVEWKLDPNDRVEFAGDDQADETPPEKPAATHHSKKHVAK